MAWIQRLSLLRGSKGVENLRALRASTDEVSAAVGSDRPKTLAVDEIPSAVGPFGAKERDVARANTET
jgi:hypothetical protein